MTLTENACDADVVIVNTCGFIEASKQESIHTVLQASELKTTGRCQALIMAGCLTQRYPKDLRAELPEVDAIIGLNEVPRIGEIIRAVLAEKSPALFWSGPATFVPDFAAPRFRLTPKHFAYVKIAEGCNHPCTFCSIPRIRGRHRSRPVADVLAEVRALVAAGCREINLISQDTTFYGRDLTAGRELLTELLREIQQLPGQFWVRLLYTHPAHWSDELIDTIAACDKVCRYVDMPLQHIHDDVLRRMKRETDGRYIRELLGKIRAGIPGIALRTTFIVGFPGETEAHFAELLEFIETARFERVGVFPYSQEDHTPAGNLADQVPPRVKKQRYRQAMTVQQRVSRSVLRDYVGRTLTVLVEAPTGDGWVGRAHLDAPDIDGRVLGRGPARVGEFASVRITGARAYDLVGTTAAIATRLR
jgi:ribosomal protein S12 methylthiotransferase